MTRIAVEPGRVAVAAKDTGRIALLEPPGWRSVAEWVHPPGDVQTLQVVESDRVLSCDRRGYVGDLHPGQEGHYWLFSFRSRAGGRGARIVAGAMAFGNEQGVWERRMDGEAALLASTSPRPRHLSWDADELVWALCDRESGMSLDGRWLLVDDDEREFGGNVNAITIVDTSTSQVAGTIRCRNPWIRWSPTGARLAVFGEGRAWIHDVPSGACVTELPLAGLVRDATWSADGGRLATTGDGLRVWDGTSGRLLFESMTPELEGSLAWREDGAFVAACTRGGIVLVRLQDGELLELHVLCTPGGPGVVAYDGRGRFDGDPLGREGLHFRGPGDIGGALLLPSSDLAPQLHRPGLIARFLRGDPIG